MIPSWRLISLVLILVLGAFAIDQQLLPAFIGSWWIWLALLVFITISVLDVLALKRMPLPSVVRKLNSQCSIAHWNDVQLSIKADASWIKFIEVYDHVPEGMQTEFLQQTALIEKGYQTTITYQLRPLHRGHFSFTHCGLRWFSPMGLWQRKYIAPCTSQIRVYPDFTRLFNGKLTLDAWLSQVGVRKVPRRGSGSDFHQLREFRQGDTLKMVDWNATAKKHMLITKELQEDRDQQVLFLLDCGRNMRSKDGDLSHFDHALNACLLLSYVALRQGDAVGLQTFAGSQRLLKPKKGTQQLTALLNTLYDVQTGLNAADYDKAFEQVLAHQTRRSFIIVLTNLRSADTKLLSATLKRIKQRHQVLFVSLREEALDQARQQPVQKLDQALEYSGAIEFLNYRQEIHQAIERQGVSLLDVSPRHLGPELISQYLAMKRAGRN